MILLPRRQLAGLLAGAVLGGSLPAAPTVAQGRAAPEFTGIDGWLNTDLPLTIAGLRGRIVLVDFWTYSCINCRRTVPYLNRWQAAYGDHGLQVVGIHTPEFGFEHMRRNVEADVRALGIQFPVGQDNEFRTWRAWNNSAWPGFYLLDREGRVVMMREGEDHAHEMDAAIRSLLDIPLSASVLRPGDDPDLSRIGTPELYYGSLHGTPQDPAQRPRSGESTYTFQAPGPGPGSYQLDGTWLRQDETLLLRSAQGGLRMRFSAARMHLVAGAPDRAVLRVRVDAGPVQAIEVTRPTLYTLCDSESYGEHLIEFETGSPGLTLFSTTFG